MRLIEHTVIARSACRSFVSGDTEIWNLTLPISQLPKDLPFGPNARNASLDAKPVKEMLSTLSKEPEKFILYNGGIMLIADYIKATRIESGKGDFTVELKLSIPTEDDEGDFLGHGVINGGHTYKSIMYALHEQKQSRLSSIDAFVQVSVAVGVDENEIKNISKARNLSLSVPLYALRNLGHDWKPIQEALPKEFRQNVVFKPNEDGEFDEKAEYNVIDLVRRLALVNNKLFDFRQEKHPVKAYASSGSLIQNWKEEDYKQVIPLLKDILWLEQKIMEQHVKINGKVATGKKVVISKVSGCSAKSMKLITGVEISLTIGDIFYMPILAAFRVLIKDGQWTKPVDELWDEWGPRLVDRLWDMYKSEGRSSASAFARSKSTWSTLTSLVAMQFVQI
jgi:AIPR protein